MQLNNEYCLVKYKNSWLTPMKKIRAFTLKNKGKAKIYKDKFTGLLVCKLLYKPSGFKVINYSCGFDFRSLFNNITVVSNKDQYTLQHNTYHNHIDNIQKKMKLRSACRRARRFDKRMRPARVRNRTRHGRMSNTINYYYLIRYRLIKEISKRFNVVNVNTEFSFNAYRKSSQYCIMGFNVLKNNCKLRLNVNLNKVAGYTTSYERKFRFGIQVYDNLGVVTNITDVKNPEKDQDDWYCHSIDSFILATLKSYRLPIHKNYYLMEVRPGFRKDRKLVRPGFKRPFWMAYPSKHWYRHRKYHKIYKVRLKIDGRKSNHGPWVYKYNYAVKPGYNLHDHIQAGYTDYQGRYYKLINGKPTCKFRNPVTLRYEYTSLRFIEGI